MAINKSRGMNTSRLCCKGKQSSTSTFAGAFDAAGVVGYCKGSRHGPGDDLLQVGRNLRALSY